MLTAVQQQHQGQGMAQGREGSWLEHILYIYNAHRAVRTQRTARSAPQGAAAAARTLPLRVRAAHAWYVRARARAYIYVRVCALRAHAYGARAALGPAARAPGARSARRVAPSATRTTHICVVVWPFPSPTGWGPDLAPVLLLMMMLH